MKWRGLPCGPESVRAYQAGRKSQTRRVIKNPARLQDKMLEGEAAEWCPYGVPGDGLYVRETHRQVSGPDWGEHQRGAPIEYRADGEHPTGLSDIRWRPGRYMPRWAARIFLELVEVRVERLQEISEADVLAEGIVDPWPTHCEMYKGQRALAYKPLWDSLNTKCGHGWETNPWVWVLTTKETEQRP